MAYCARRLARLFLPFLLILCAVRPSEAVDARFDLVGPRINVRVTRNGVTLPIAEVPNLQPGDRLWLHPDLPRTQSVKYLLICVFLRGTTNPPPEGWFTRIETWQKQVREEGVFVTVPAEAQQAVLFLAPETGGDYSTLKSAVQGRPGVFVRASQDLAEAGFEQARIEKYLSDIRLVPPSDANELQKRSDLLARTLALKPNEECFKRPIDMQFTCLTQTGSQSLLDDGHGNSIVSALSTGPGSDLINAASYTSLGGGGLYSAYVGAVVDLVRLTSTLHTAQYQYIPAIAFPQGDAMNLRLNAPPSFHNPKSVLVIGLPSIQPSVTPPLRPADANHVACLLRPQVVLPIEGAPLVFSTDLAHDLVLHLNVPPGAPPEPDIPLVADAYHGGLVLQREPQHHIPLHPELAPAALTHPDAKKPEKPVPPPKPQPEPIRLTGTIEGQWGFDSFIGPTVPLQQLPGSNWQIASTDDAPSGALIAGHAAQLLITSTGSACVHTITAQRRGSNGNLNIDFKPAPAADQPNLLALTLPSQKNITPGDLHFAIQQYGQPKADELSARTFSELPHIDSLEIHAADRTLLLTGARLNEIEKASLGDLNFTPQAVPHDGETPEPTETANSLRLALPNDAPAPPTKVGDHLTARISLRDGRSLTEPVIVSAPRPVVTLLSKRSERPAAPVEHDAGAHAHHAQPQLARLGRLRLPGHARLREEVVPRRRVLVERLLAARAVVADGGAADQGTRPAALARLAAGRAVIGCAGRPQSRDQVAGAGDTALANRPLGARAPALGDVLPGEVHDRVPAGERRHRGGLLERIPAHGLHAQRLRRLDARPAGEHRDLRALLAQLGDERAADQPTCSRHGHAHRDPPLARG